MSEASLIHILLEFLTHNVELLASGGGGVIAYGAAHMGFRAYRSRQPACPEENAEDIGALAAQVKEDHKTLGETTSKLDSHEAQCEVRHKEINRRLGTIEENGRALMKAVARIEGMLDT